MQLRFHMICIPGTARIAALAALSFVRHSPYHLSIVLNGLEQTETEFLEQVAARNDRLELHPCRSAMLVSHADMLNRLSEQETSDWFCFMDSDIFASEPFSRKLDGILKTCDVFSSCYPLASGSNSLTTGYSYLSLQSPAGKQLATTFFCAYRMDVLRQVKEACNVGFECTPINAIPHQCHKWISDDDLRSSDDMDTGKLLTLLAHSFGYRTHYDDLNELAHIGGISSRGWEKKWKWKLSNYFQQRFVLTDHDLSPDDRRFALFDSNLRKLRASTDIRKRDHYLNKILRQRVASFFAAHVNWKYGDGPLPEIRLSNSELSDRVEAVCRTLEQIDQDDCGLVWKNDAAA
jgi:hypothetical protein